MPSTSSPATPPAPGTVSASRSCASWLDVGARWHEIQGDDPARAIASFARLNQITQIVIGSSRRRRWQQLTGGGSNVTRVIKEAGALGIDVHVIALRKPLPGASSGAGADEERPGLAEVKASEAGKPGLPGLLVGRRRRPTGRRLVHRAE
jgi:hypothetical protein